MNRYNQLINLIDCTAQKTIEIPSPLKLPIDAIFIVQQQSLNVKNAEVIQQIYTIAPKTDPEKQLLSQDSALAKVIAKLELGGHAVVELETTTRIDLLGYRGWDGPQNSESETDLAKAA